MINRIRKKLNREMGKLTSRKMAEFPAGRMVASFTFDDFPFSAKDAGARILEERGVRGTFYASLGSFDRVGFPSRNDLLELVAEGHEVGGHTYSHIDCGAVPVDQVRSDCLKNTREILDITGAKVNAFAYPFGEFSPGSKKLIGELYATARMVQPGINRNSIDLLALYAVPIDIRGGLEMVNKWLLDLQRDGGWAIFYTHGVCENPTAYDCTEELLSESVDLCREAGCELMTVREASSLC